MSVNRLGYNAVPLTQGFSTNCKTKWRDETTFAMRGLWKPQESWCPKQRSLLPQAWRIVRIGLWDVLNDVTLAQTSMFICVVAFPNHWMKSTMADIDPPGMMRRGPRFVLMVIAVLIVLAAIFRGPTGSRIHRSSQQQRVASFIREQGGVVRFLSESGAESDVVPGFTCELLGDRYCADAHSLNWAPESSDDLHLIESFPKLMALHLEGTVVTDAAFGHLVNLPKLSVLSIDGAVLGPTQSVRWPRYRSCESYLFRIARSR